MNSYIEKVDFFKGNSPEEIAKEYGNGKVHLTTRQGFEIEGIHIQDMAAVNAKLQPIIENLGINQVDPDTGYPASGTRNICACIGNEVCPFANYKTSDFAKRVEKDGHYYLMKCFDQNKDQTYFLSQINEEQIKSCLFPLGDIDKVEVRKIAHELGLESVMDKKDSTGVCFIGERNFREFLKNYIPAQKGQIIDIDTGKVIGEHRGVYYYTIGQHKGLGIGGISGETAAGWFIVKKDAKKNILYVTRGDAQKYLMSNKCIVRKLNFINKDEIFPQEVGVKFRYRQPDHPAVINLVNGEIVCEYDYYKAVTPGQEAVFYNKDGLMIGSGTIDEVYRDNVRIDK